MKNLTRHQVNEKIAGNGDKVALVEVLSEEKFRDFHLPGAMNVPLGPKFDDQIQTVVPEKDTPVIVYCWDKDCEASSKAAARLDELGYHEVYDYEAGKADWKAAGLPVET